MTYEQAIEELRGVLARMSHESTEEMYRTAAEIRDAKEQVRARYVPIFSPQSHAELTAEDFGSFLLFENNRHWPLHRLGGWMTADMRRLRQALKILADEAIPISTRLNRLRPSTGEAMVRGLGRAVITAILQVLYPDRYGIWNNTAEAGMKQLHLWPDMPRATSFGERYELMNEVLLRVARDLGVDLWTLDILWWRVAASAPRVSESRPAELEVDEGRERRLDGPAGAEHIFGLERYLQEFLVDNWPATTLGGEWDLFEEDGEIVGSYYSTEEIGEIDLLAKHKRDDRWLVIELKRNQTSDDTVGQVLRYMGWVRRNRAESGAGVEGLIICHRVDKKLRYALDGQQNIRCMTYRVNFELNPVQELQDATMPQKAT